MRIFDPTCEGCSYEYPELSKRNLCQACEVIYWKGFEQGYKEGKVIA